MKWWLGGDWPVGQCPRKNKDFDHRESRGDGICGGAKFGVAGAMGVGVCSRGTESCALAVSGGVGAAPADVGVPAFPSIRQPLRGCCSFPRDLAYESLGGTCPSPDFFTEEKFVWL